MKKVLKTALITIILLSLATGGLIYLIMNREKLPQVDEAKKQEEESGESLKKTYVIGAMTDVLPLKVEGPSKNVLSFDTAKPYEVKTSQDIAERIERLKNRTNPDYEEPLIVYNPFGIAPNTFYFNFKTSSSVQVKYKVIVKDETIPDFVRTVYNGTDDNLSQEHEFVVGGIIPGMENYIMITLCDGAGEELARTVYSYEAKESTSAPSTITVKKSEESPDATSNGLFVACYDGMKEMSTYDNSGYLRNQVLLEDKVGKNLIIHNDKIMYQVSKTKIVSVSPIGKVTAVYKLSKYGTITGFDFDGFGNLYVIMRKNENDRLVQVNIETNSSKKIFEFPKEIESTDIALFGNGGAYISTKKPEGILVMKNLASSVAIKVSGVLGKKEKWTNTAYRKKCYKPEGKRVAGKIYSLSYDEESKKLSFVTRKRRVSEYYSYEVNMKKKSFKVKNHMAKDVSKAYGSGQVYGEHFIIASGDNGVFYELDSAGRQIKKFTTGKPLRKTSKINLKNTCFK